MILIILVSFFYEKRILKLSINEGEIAMMKKMKKWLVVGLLGSSIGMGTLGQSVHAETDWQSIYEELVETSMELQPTSGTYQLTANLVGADELSVNGDVDGAFKFTTEPLTAQGNVTIKGLVNPPASEEDAHPQNIDFTGEAIYVDDTVYYNTGFEWEVINFDGFEEQFAEIFDQIKDMQGQTPEDWELVQQLYDFEETDTEYIMTLKDDVSYEQVLEMIDLEELKEQSRKNTEEMIEEIEQAIEEARQEAEEAGEDPEEFVGLTEEEKQEMLNSATENIEEQIKLGIQALKDAEIHYDKETKRMTYTRMEIELDGPAIREVMEEVNGMTEEESAVLDEFKLMLTLEIHIDPEFQGGPITAPTLGSSVENEAAEESEEVSEEASEEESSDESVEETEAESLEETEAAEEETSAE